MPVVRVLCGLGRVAGLVGAWGMRWHLRMGVWLARMGIFVALGPLRWFLGAIRRESAEAAKDQFAR
jgi:hypothetical protein